MNIMFGIHNSVYSDLHKQQDTALKIVSQAEQTGAG